MAKEDIKEFFTAWRRNLALTAPMVKVESAKWGIYGVMGVAIAVASTDPSVAAGLMMGLAGNFISARVEGWRKADKESESSQIERIANDLKELHAESQADFQEAMQQLNIAQITLDAFSDKLDQCVSLLKDLADKKLAIDTQQVTINTSGGPYIGGGVQGNSVALRDIIYHWTYAEYERIGEG